MLIRSSKFQQTQIKSDFADTLLMSRNLHSSIQKIPPPSISLSMPSMMAMPQSTMPPFDFTRALMIKPMMAKGILIQFNQPSKGIKANNIPNAERIPSMRPIIFMIYRFLIQSLSDSAFITCNLVSNNGNNMINSKTVSSLCQC
jgi:hypothetical protein